MCHMTKQNRLEMNLGESQYSLCLAYFLKDSRIIGVVVISKVDHPFIGTMLTDPG